MSRESPAHVRPRQLHYPEISTHVRPVTPTHVPRPPLYLDHVILTCSASISNVFVSNTHSYAYIAFSITTLFSILYPGSCLLHNTTLDPFSYLAGLGLLITKHAFLRIQCRNRAAGCKVDQDVRGLNQYNKTPRCYACELNRQVLIPIHLRHQLRTGILLPSGLTSYGSHPTA